MGAVWIMSPGVSAGTGAGTGAGGRSLLLLDARVVQVELKDFEKADKLLRERGDRGSGGEGVVSMREEERGRERERERGGERGACSLTSLSTSSSPSVLIIAKSSAGLSSVSASASSSIACPSPDMTPDTRPFCFATCGPTSTRARTRVLQVHTSRAMHIWGQQESGAYLRGEVGVDAVRDQLELLLVRRDSLDDGPLERLWRGSVYRIVGGWVMRL